MSGNDKNTSLVFHDEVEIEVIKMKGLNKLSYLKAVYIHVYH
jgi:hypothetical protein